MTSRYAATQSYQQASKYLRKDFGIWVFHEMLRKRILAIAEQIKDIRDNDTGQYHYLYSDRFFTLQNYLSLLEHDFCIAEADLIGLQ